MVLVGSLARGDYTAFSDADVVVVVPEGSVPDNQVDRASSFMDPSLPVETRPLVYAESEMSGMAPGGQGGGARDPGGGRAAGRPGSPPQIGGGVAGSAAGLSLGAGG